MFRTTMRILQLDYVLAYVVDGFGDEHGNFSFMTSDLKRNSFQVIDAFFVGTRRKEKRKKKNGRSKC